MENTFYTHEHGEKGGAILSVLVGIHHAEVLKKLLHHVSLNVPLLLIEDRHTILQQLQKPHRAIVIDVACFADHFPWELTGMLRQWHPSTPILLLSSETVYDSLYQEVLERLCGKEGIDVLPIGRTTTEWNEALLAQWTQWGLVQGVLPQEISRASEGIVATLLAASPKDGATTVALNTAWALAQHTSLRIGLLDLNLKNPELGFLLPKADRTRSNIALRARLQTGALESLALWEGCDSFRKYPHLRMLHGSHRRDTASDVSAQMVETLLHTARHTFDITLVDVSSYPDNAATVCAVRGANMRFLVAQPQISSYGWSIGEWFSCYWHACGVTPESMHLIMNRMEAHQEKPERISHYLNMPLAAVLPEIPYPKRRKSFDEGVPLYEQHIYEYNAAIHRIASLVTKRLGQPALPVLTKQRRYTLFSLRTGSA